MIRFKIAELCSFVLCNCALSVSKWNYKNMPEHTVLFFELSGYQKHCQIYNFVAECFANFKSNH